MAQDLGEVVRVQRVHDVEEVLAGRPLILRVVIREVGVEDRVLLELGEERLDRELVVLGYLDLLDLQLLEQLLLAAEDILEEVLVDKALRRQVELEAITKIEVRIMIEVFYEEGTIVFRMNGLIDVISPCCQLRKIRVISPRCQPRKIRIISPRCQLRKIRVISRRCQLESRINLLEDPRSSSSWRPSQAKRMRKCPANEESVFII